MNDASRFLEEITSYSRQENLEIVIFSAVAEPWKKKYNDYGWHLWDEELQPQPVIIDFLAEIEAEYKGE